MKWNFGAWNVRTLLDSSDRRGLGTERRTALIARELARYSLDIVALSETRRSGSGALDEVGGGYTYFWQGVPEGHKQNWGVGFAVKTPLVKLLELAPVGVSERVMYLRVPLKHNRWLTVFSVYAPTLDSDPADKNAFYSCLEQLLLTVPSKDKLLILGDFNARVGTDNTNFERVMGKNGHGNRNDNGLQLLNMCLKTDLFVTNTMFKLKDIYKTTWQHSRSRKWYVLDCVLVRRRDRQDVHSSRVRRGAECHTDHQLLVSAEIFVFAKPRFSLTSCQAPSC
jgi:exonuclease III